MSSFAAVAGHRTFQKSYTVQFITDVGNVTVVVGPSHAENHSIRYTIITAVYNVGRYLPDFMRSIEAQQFPLDQIQVVAVDDGSTDDSLQQLMAWSQRRPALVTVLSKENGGQGSARNFGLSAARGEWITYTDPDDMLAPDYFSAVDQFITAHPEVSMVATNRILFDERTGKEADRHPLRRFFRGGDQLVDLTRFPTYFHGSAPAAFMRTSVLRRHGLQFDDRIQPNFEDGHFCSSYLTLVPPIVGFVRSARYIYRKRGDQTSTLQNSLQHPGRFENVPKYGYLDLLRRSAQDTGRAPEWVQNIVLYELSYYFSAEESMSNSQTAAKGVVAEAFLNALKEIRGYIDDDAIESFSLRRFERSWRDFLLHGLDGRQWHTPYAVLQAYDPDRGQVRIAYRYIGAPPEELFLSRGKPVEVLDGKTRTLDYFDRVLLWERIAWVPADGTVRLLLNGRAVELRESWPGPVRRSLRPVEIRRHFGLAEESAARRRSLARYEMRRQATTFLANTWPVRLRFRNAWVLMDRIHDADDSGERLFHYLRDQHPRINAWFVVERGTADFNRLKRQGHRRVVAHGSLQWKLLMLNCRHLISSHIDVPVHRPPEILALRKPSWKFTFLQHGVIKDDLSRWLNQKAIDLFVTSTPAEHASITADGTPYVFTTKEVKRTGLPRFDRLKQLGDSVPVAERDLVLVAPTWRHWLTPPLEVGSQRRLVYDDFFESQFTEEWLAFLCNEELRDIARRNGLKIGFLPHPNLQSALSDLDLPDDVLRLSFHGEDVQGYFARAALLVTDYSSMAFNAAYIDRPVLYFQFDRDRVLSGGHVGRAGYFDYKRDGFGPVVEDVPAAIAEAKSIVARGNSLAPEYSARVQAAFPDRDGRCCERVVAAIEALDRPGKPMDAGVTVKKIVARSTRVARARSGILKRWAVGKRR